MKLVKDEDEKQRLKKIKESSEFDFDPFIAGLTLGDMEVVSTLGVGGFGKVELVRVKNHKHLVNNSTKVYALKSCAKKFIRSTAQEDHINNERVVQLMASKHQFIIKLWRTFKDDHHVYFLMEAALGGELWTMLRHRQVIFKLTELN